ncbi:hypothetical protein ADIWIN_2434 [Winogradskyella psychrotolerans RS-3]|uniref:Uncharacterized protein n=1 Tax=Winogradskyella psychrotolerans RS-3 TaxID=641526 RepID=S7X0J4_9FLAO|nr:hypothetical protein [Winogradskyella psychrotolerans]EPR72544.1 hypothetical protein ADIWIN_2434 [Winogradskyella psychrotolerans RS-3]
MILNHFLEFFTLYINPKIAAPIAMNADVAKVKEANLYSIILSTIAAIV